MLKFTLIALVLVLSSINVFAQDVSILTPQGSKFTGKWESNSVKLKTKHGDLNISVDDIREIKVGYHIEEDMRTNVDKWISQLGSTAVKQREDATKSLVKHYRFSYNLLRYIKIPDREISKRIEEILDNIGQDKNLSNYTCEDDILYMSNGDLYTGTILTENIEVNSVEIGKVKLHLANICNINFHKTISLTLNANEVCGKWFDTKLSLNEVKMSASGTIDLWPTQPMQYMSTPNGSQQSTGENGVYKMGSLVGKIGVNGETFFIGESSSYNFKYQSGTLYLRVIAPPRNWGITEPNGQYVLKIQ
jgi:hypothetical protein